MYNSIVKGIGHYVPEKIVTNDDLAKIMDTSDEWITERTGIKERRYFDPKKDTVQSMGAEASRIALDRAGLKPEDVDMIVFATLSPHYYFPGSGVLMQRELGIPAGVPSLDVRNACSGFMYSLSVADQFIKTGMYKTVLVVGSEIHSSGLDKTTRGRNVAVIFGDGAGAAVLQRSEEKGRGILSTHLHADGNFAEELCIKQPSSANEVWMNHDIVDHPDSRPYMNGNLVFKHAVVRFLEVIGEALKANQMTSEDINLLIPHQANLRISEFVRMKLKLAEGMVFNNIMKYGNTTAASIPIALSEAWEQGKIKEGDTICLAAFGSGFTWASALIKW
ncbi:MAG: ketoacyl-ACP synthase III [Cytophagales bacterium]|nr:ketoacyl-ACP synthase III [Cytophagales bacterium]